MSGAGPKDQRMNNLVTTLVFLRRSGADGDDEILLAMKKRGWGAGLWNGAGGKLQPDESAEQAMIRECEEEIAVIPLAYTKVAEHDFVLPQEDGADEDNTDAAATRHIFTHTYLCTEWQGEPAETEEMAPQWFKITDIPYHQMWQDDRDWLPLVLDGKKLRTVFTFSAENQLISQQITEVNGL
jgi:8-oxo-dGTP pyrophosphatase MutT (NUDIX family)